MNSASSASDSAAHVQRVKPSERLVAYAQPTSATPEAMR
jgi:hypothetical protein